MQNYQNHRRIFPLHHFILLPITLTVLVWSIINLFNCELDIYQQIFQFLGAIGLFLSALIGRLYATKNQDRIIRMEVRLRYFELSGKSFGDKEKQLKLSQIIALRFAGDQEFLTLIDKSITEKLSSKEIKLAITDWQADERRV